MPMGKKGILKRCGGVYGKKCPLVFAELKAIKYIE